jgi:plastocyanin
MRLLLSAVALAGLIGSELHAATVRGKVAFLTKRGQRPILEETLVSLEPVSSAAPRRNAGSFVMTTRGKTFLPHVLVVPAGSTVSFPNEDPISHNLFSLTPGNTFDLGLYRKGSTPKTKKFDSAGAVNVYCNIHPNMSAVVQVMNTPYYAFADGQGTFAIDAPAGRYRLVAWNEQGGTTTSSVEVKGDGSVAGATQLTIDSRNHRVLQHTNKEGKSYPKGASRDY